MRNDIKQSLSRLLAAFGLADVITDAEEKRAVARYSRSNVRLQLGQVMTEREYKAQKEAVLSYDFC